jgi:hypothetical protein
MLCFQGAPVRVLIYKRTHNGDPDEAGRFGVYDCMGAVRDCEFEAVIGVGGVGVEARRHGIDGKVNWIGIGPHRRSSRTRRASIVTFDHFLDFGTEGPQFDAIAPKLARRMYRQKIRYLIGGFRDGELDEIEEILNLARRTAPSKGRTNGRSGMKQIRACTARSRQRRC